MKKRGVAVIMAMWLLAVLAIIGTTFAFMMRLEPIIAHTHRDDMRAMYIAQAGLDHAVYILKQDTDRDLDYFGETWATNFTGSDVDNDGDGAADSKWITLTDEKTPPNTFGYYAVKITDEASKININNINTGHPDAQGYGGQKKLLMDLPEIGEAKAKNIIDYQKDTANNGPYEYLEEVLCVKDVGTATYSANKNLITVYSPIDTDTVRTAEDRAAININTANSTILTAVLDPIDYVGTVDYPIEWLVDDIIAYRAGSDGVEGTADDNPFNDRTEFNTFIDNEKTAGRISNAAVNRIKDNANPTSTQYGDTAYDCWTTEFSFASDASGKKESNFEVISTGKFVTLGGREVIKRIKAIAEKGKVTPASGSRVKYWEEIPED